VLAKVKRPLSGKCFANVGKEEQKVIRILSGLPDFSWRNIPERGKINHKTSQITK
jgi:hypothetical protein